MRRIQLLCSYCTGGVYSQLTYLLTVAIEHIFSLYFDWNALKSDPLLLYACMFHGSTYTCTFMASSIYSIYHEKKLPLALYRATTIYLAKHFLSLNCSKPWVYSILWNTQLEVNSRIHKLAIDGRIVVQIFSLSILASNSSIAVCIYK